jgi:hypothetical protein|tara:strand:- start:1395 stop:2048 length:654 start_codon:yes stop_codon:yes gene_type:complete
MKFELTIPSSLSEISLKQYKKFLKIQESNEDSYFLQCKMIEIFCNLDAKSVRLLKLTDADRVVQIINKMFEEKPQLIRTFKLGGIEYGLIPNLDEISLGEYVDLDTYMGDWQNMQIAMNVLFRPIKEKIGDKYLIKDYDVESKDLLQEIPMDVVFGAVFFLYNLGIDLSKVMMDYLEDNQMDNLMEQQIFQESMDGIKASSLHSLKVMLDELKISLN